jgi:DNA helicase IV
MQWRMVGRRGATATWTVVGDPAQSLWPHPQEAAEAREAALGGGRPGERARSYRSMQPRHRFHMDTNYRNSAEIYGFAAEYAERVGLDADLPLAVRKTGVEPVELTVDRLEEGVRKATLELLDAVRGTVGVVVPEARRAEVAGWLGSWPEVAEARAGGDDARLVTLSGVDTKGLEFDGIVVVEPQEIEAESPTGRATLYVVLTRATQRLVTVTAG